MKITKDTYQLYCKYGGELLWVSDPIREPRPKGTNEETDEELRMLARLDESLEMLHNQYYSSKLKEEYASEVERLKPMVAEEAFTLMESNYKV